MQEIVGFGSTLIICSGGAAGSVFGLRELRALSRRVLPTTAKPIAAIDKKLVKTV